VLGLGEVGRGGQVNVDIVAKYMVRDCCYKRPEPPHYLPCITRPVVCDEWFVHADLLISRLIEHLIAAIKQHGSEEHCCYRCQFRLHLSFRRLS